MFLEEFGKNITKIMEELDIIEMTVKVGVTEQMIINSESESTVTFTITNRKYMEKYEKSARISTANDSTPRNAGFP